MLNFSLRHPAHCSNAYFWNVEGKKSRLGLFLPDDFAAAKSCSYDSALHDAKKNPEENLSCLWKQRPADLQEVKTAESFFHIAPLPITKIYL